MNKRDQLKSLGSVTIVGSGQSAAEVFYDLLQSYDGDLHWFTRSSRFFPMDYSKLTLEMSTPDYIKHFFNLPAAMKQKILNTQNSLYKGINQSLISDIYDALAERNSGKIQLHTNCELKGITEDLTLRFRHSELDQEFENKPKAVILATGYTQILPEFLEGIRTIIQIRNGGYEASLNYCIDTNNTVYIQNGEQNSHGFNAADLSLGPYRNAVILNSILGYEFYSVETEVSFQSFGLPKIQRT